MNEPETENIPLPEKHNSGDSLSTAQESCSNIEYGREYHIWTNLSSLADVLNNYLQNRRQPVLNREYSLPKCDSLTRMQADGWTIYSRIRLPPTDPEEDYDLYEEKYPALLLLRLETNGKWRADEDCPWRLPSYDELLWGFYGHMNQGKTAKLCGLVVNMSLPLTGPQDVLRGPLYGFAADCEAKIVELTDGIAAVQNFADTMKNL